MAQALADPMGRIRLAGRAGSDPVGFLAARRVAELVEIDLLGVAPEQRRCGIAAALLADLIEREAAAGAHELRLELREANVGARALYAGLGFVVVGRRSRYYPDGENALLLTRTLSTGRDPRSDPGSDLESSLEG